MVPLIGTYDRQSSRPLGHNNFDLLRILAAAVVLLAHSFFLAGHADPLYPVTGLPMGALGVAIFFTISGYLICASWKRDPHIVRFFIRRSLRVIPALIVVSFLTAFLIGPIMTDLSASSYFTSAAPYWYAIHNSVLLTFNSALPGLFDSNPTAGIVNGSLWTLPIEALSYLIVGLTGLLSWLRPRLAGILIVILLGVVVLRPGAHSPSGQSPLIDTVALAMWYVSLFLAGALAQMAVKAFRFRLSILLVLSGVWIASWDSRYIYLTSGPLIAYSVLHAGSAPAIKAARMVTHFGDLSYGVYIYAFPIQQSAVLLLGSSVTPWLLLACAAPPTAFCAVLSWNLVESYALRHKPREAYDTTQSVASHSPGEMLEA